MIFRMSFSGGALILLALTLRFLAINKLPKRTFVLLWHIVLLRLLLPFDLPIQYGVALPAVRFADHIFNEQAASDNLALNGNVNQPIMEKATSAGNNSDVAAKTSTRNFIDIMTEHVFLIVWALGAAIVMAVLLALYRKERLKTQAALPISAQEECRWRALAIVPKRVRFLVSDQIASPLTFGVLSPKIVLSKNLQAMDNQQLKYVLLHELVHIKRADQLWKLMMLVVVCLHWFNPLVWLMYILFNRDIELSCDEKVISLLGEDIKKEYANALVALAETQCNRSLFSYGFGKNAIQERIVAIMKFKKATVLSFGCTALLLGAAITVFAQNEAQTENKVSNDILDQSGDYEIYADYKVEGHDVKESEGTFTVEETYNVYTLENSDLLPEYEQNGLSYDSQKQQFIFEGNIVGYIDDEKDGVKYLWGNEQGTIGLSVLRDDNDKIIGMEKIAVPEEMDQIDGIDKGTGTTSISSVTFSSDGVSSQAIVCKEQTE